MDTHLLLALFHIFFVVPLFIYVAINKSDTLEVVYKGLLGLGLFIVLYHAGKAYFRWLASSSMLWINVIHILFVGPLLVYIGYYAKNTPRPAYEMLALLGFSALGYHLYSLVTSLNIVKTTE